MAQQIEIREKNGDLFAISQGKIQEWHTVTEDGKIVLGKLIWDEDIEDAKQFWRVFGDGMHDVYTRQLGTDWTQHFAIASNSSHLIPKNIIAFAVNTDEASLYNAKLLSC